MRSVVAVAGGVRSLKKRLFHININHLPIFHFYSSWSRNRNESGPLIQHKGWPATPAIPANFYNAATCFLAGFLGVLFSCASGRCSRPLIQGFWDPWRGLISNDLPGSKSLTVQSDGVDFYEHIFRQPRNFYACACRLVLCEKFRINFVHCLKLIHVFDEHRCLYDFVHAGP